MVSFGAIARKFFGSANDRRVRGYRSSVEAISALEDQMILRFHMALNKCA